MSKTPYPALSIAYNLCDLSKWSLPNLKLQKLLYLCQMMHSGGDVNKMPLMDGKFVAYPSGPVHQEVYNQVTGSKQDAVPKKAFGNGDFTLPSSEREDLAFILGKYISSHPYDLVELTHDGHGAWARVYGSGRHYNEITYDKIAEEFQRRTARYG